MKMLENIVGKMKRFGKTVTIGVLLGAYTVGLAGCTEKPKAVSEGNRPDVTSEAQQPQNEIWYGYGLNQDGLYDCISTPHRWIVAARGDSIGDLVLEHAQTVDKLKNQWAAAQGRPELPPSYCSIEDLDHDGNADIVAWPRIYEMPIVVNPSTHATYTVTLGTRVKYMSERMQREANTVLWLEQSIQGYNSQH
ncbi:MAG: hypothetical protein V1743_08420 [Nanoarchaeota archaeon]